MRACPQISPGSPRLPPPNPACLTSNPLFTLDPSQATAKRLWFPKHTQCPTPLALPPLLSLRGEKTLKHPSELGCGTTRSWKTPLPPTGLDTSSGAPSTLCDSRMARITLSPCNRHRHSLENSMGRTYVEVPTANQGARPDEQGCKPQRRWPRWTWAGDRPAPPTHSPGTGGHCGWPS